MPLSEDDKQKLDALVIKMEASGESEDSIRTVVNDYQTRYGSMQGTAERFGEGVGRQLKGAVTGAYDAVAHPINTYHGLVDQSAQNFGEAGKLAGEGEYGHALMHGISGLISPFAAVTDAGDRWRKGDVSGALGDATGLGLLPHVPAALKGVAKGVPKVIGASVRATPEWAVPAAGAVVGGLMDGPRGFMEGAVGGGILGRAMPRLRQLGKPSENAGGKLSRTPAPEPRLDAAEIQRILEEAKLPDASESVEIKSSAPGGDAMRTVGANRNAIRQMSSNKAEFTPSQEAGLSNLDQLMNDLHGDDWRPQGNGTFKPQSSQPKSLPDRYKQLTRSAILSPEDAMALEHLDKVMKQRASREGMRHASGKEPVRKRAVTK